MYLQGVFHRFSTVQDLHDHYPFYIFIKHIPLYPEHFLTEVLKLSSSILTSLMKNHLNKFQLFRMRFQREKIWQHDYLKVLQQWSKGLCVTLIRFSMDAKTVIHEKTIQSLLWKQGCITFTSCGSRQLKQGSISKSY